MRRFSRFLWCFSTQISLAITIIISTILDHFAWAIKTHPKCKFWTILNHFASAMTHQKWPFWTILDHFAWLGYNPPKMTDFGPFCMGYNPPKMAILNDFSSFWMGWAITHLNQCLRDRTEQQKEEGWKEFRALLTRLQSDISYIMMCLFKIYLNPSIFEIFSTDLVLQSLPKWLARLAVFLYVQKCAGLLAYNQLWQRLYFTL